MSCGGDPRSHATPGSSARRRAAFDREPRDLTPKGLVLNRYGSEIRFIRVRP